MLLVVGVAKDFLNQGQTLIKKEKYLARSFENWLTIWEHWWHLNRDRFARIVYACAKYSPTNNRTLKSNTTCTGNTTNVLEQTPADMTVPGGDITE